MGVALLKERFAEQRKAEVDEILSGVRRLIGQQTKGGTSFGAHGGREVSLGVADEHWAPHGRTAAGEQQGTPRQQVSRQRSREEERGQRASRGGWEAQDERGGSQRRPDAPERSNQATSSRGPSSGAGFSSDDPLGLRSK